MDCSSDFLQHKKHNPLPLYARQVMFRKGTVKFRDRRGTLLSLPSTML